MYNTASVMVGLVVLVGAGTSPFWLNAIGGKSLDLSKVEYTLPDGSCIESKEYMRTSHMDLLDEWRDSVVREGVRSYELKPEIKEKLRDKYPGGFVPMSLTNTCLDCHESREVFCNKCHEYAGVSPYCWDCHLDSKGGK